MNIDLEPIKKRHAETEEFCRARHVAPPHCQSDRAALIAEVERLRVERTALIMEIAKLDPEWPTR